MSASSRTTAYDVTPAADMVLIAKKADLTTGAGYACYIDTTGVPQCIIADGTLTTVASGPALTDGQRHVIAVVRDTTADTITVYTDGVAGAPVTDTTTATLANADAMRLGRLSGAGTNYFDGEDASNAVWREALTDAEVAAAGEAILGNTFIQYAWRTGERIQMSSGMTRRGRGRINA